MYRRKVENIPSLFMQAKEEIAADLIRVLHRLTDTDYPLMKSTSLMLISSKLMEFLRFWRSLTCNSLFYLFSLTLAVAIPVSLPGETV